MSTSRLPFFDPDKARGGRRSPDVGAEGNSEIAEAGNLLENAPLTVTALVMRIKGAMAEAFPQRITVIGEISNFKQHSSGHLYFRLKDSTAAIDAAMWRQHAMRLKFTPVDGLEVIVEGRVDVYETRGQLQLYVESMTPKGAGALELAFRQLRDKLQQEGLFDPSAKAPIPRFPRAIGVITSPTGAAIRDISHTLKRRWKEAKVYLLPVLVQGEGSAQSIAEAVALMDANAERYKIDTIILARGGGSLEDLWSFNEEIVARAIFAARTPIICGVGHETDVTIADLVADRRAATPTAAAELAVPDAREAGRQLDEFRSRLMSLVADRIRTGTAALAGACRSVVFRDPSWRVRSCTQRIDELTHRLRADVVHADSAAHRRLEPVAARLAAVHPAAIVQRARAGLDRLTGRLAWALGGQSKRSGDALAVQVGRLMAANPENRLRLLRQKVDAIERQLDAMSYRSVLRRGFSVTRSADGRILRRAAQARPSQLIETELVDGRIASRVESTSRQPQTPPPQVGKGRKKTGKNNDDKLSLFD